MEGSGLVMGRAYTDVEELHGGGWFAAVMGVVCCFQACEESLFCLLLSSGNVCTHRLNVRLLYF